MKAEPDFDPIEPDEEFALAFDFTNYLVSGDSVASVVSWTCAVADISPAPDDTPSSRLSGSPSVDATGKIVMQTVVGCLADVIYTMEALVDTVEGERLSLWAYQPCLGVGTG